MTARALGVLEAAGLRTAVFADVKPNPTETNVAAGLAALRDGGHADFAAALEWEALAQPVTLATEDLQEGIRAAAERRAPEFTGR